MVNDFAAFIMIDIKGVMTRIETILYVTAAPCFSSSSFLFCLFVCVNESHRRNDLSNTRSNTLCHPAKRIGQLDQPSPFPFIRHFPSQ